MSVGYQLVIRDGHHLGLFHGAFLVRLIVENLEEIHSFIIFDRNPVLLTIYEILQLNNLCSINLWLTLNALVLLT